MFGQAALRNPKSSVAEIMRNLRDLETRIRHLDPRDATRVSVDVADSVGAALEDITDRFRNGAGYVAREAARMGHRANVAGRDSYKFLKREVDAHPLAVLALAVAAGIGILIGASLYRRSRNSSPEPKQRRRITRKARK